MAGRVPDLFFGYRSVRQASTRLGARWGRGGPKASRPRVGRGAGPKAPRHAEVRIGRNCSRAEAEELSEREFLDRTLVADLGSTLSYRMHTSPTSGWKPGTCDCALCAVAPDARDEVSYDPSERCI